MNKKKRPAPIAIDSDLIKEIREYMEEYISNYLQQCVYDEMTDRQCMRWVELNYIGGLKQFIKDGE